MILIVTNKFDPHADAVINHLKEKGTGFLRFNTEDFPTKIKISLLHENGSFRGYLALPIGTLDISKVESVWYRRPQPPYISKDIGSEFAREFALKEGKATLSNLWRVLDCFWVNHPRLVWDAENKLSQLKIASSLGLQIPKTLVTNDPEKAKDFFGICKGKMINKVIGRGMIEEKNRTLLIYTHKIARKDLSKMGQVKYAPALFQEYVPKKIEIRITIVGKEVFPVEIHSQEGPKTKDDWRRYDFERTPHYPHNLPKEIEEKCFALLEKFQLNFGAIDMVLTPNDEYVFLELNPNGQWLWLERLTSLPISKEVAKLLINAGQD